MLGVRKGVLKIGSFCVGMGVVVVVMFVRNSTDVGHRMDAKL